MFKLQIETDNAAFEDDEIGELVRILRAIADRINGGIGSESKTESIRDINGNRVGEWSLR